MFRGGTKEADMGKVIGHKQKLENLDNGYYKTAIKGMLWIQGPFWAVTLQFKVKKVWSMRKACFFNNFCDYNNLVSCKVWEITCAWMRPWIQPSFVLAQNTHYFCCSCNKTVEKLFRKTDTCRKKVLEEADGRKAICDL